MEFLSSRLRVWSLRLDPDNRSHISRPKKPLAMFIASGFALFLGFGIAPTLQAFDKPVEDAANKSATASANTKKSQRRHQRNQTYLKRQWGIEILHVRQSAGGYMLEFRYKVHDAEKAKPLFERKTKPLLTHTETGAILVVPTPAKTGALRNSNLPMADHTYWMFFANPGNIVKSGQHVDIAIGDFQAKNIIVQ